MFGDGCDYYGGDDDGDSPPGDGLGYEVVGDASSHHSGASLAATGAQTGQFVTMGLGPFVAGGAVLLFGTRRGRGANAG